MTILIYEFENFAQNLDMSEHKLCINHKPGELYTLR